MLGVEVLAREPPLDPGRALAHGVLDLLFQVHDRIRAHQFSSLVVSVRYRPAGDTPEHRHPSAHQVASDAACSGGDLVGGRGAGIRVSSRRKPAPVSAIATAAPHQMAFGDVASIATPAKTAVAASVDSVFVASRTASMPTAKIALVTARACVRRIRATTRVAGTCATTMKKVLMKTTTPISPAPTGVCATANGGRMLEK